MKGKLIVIEGTDCSGKQTQSDLLLEKLNDQGIRCFKSFFPQYDTPTGRIVGGPYLGKSYICEGWFPEGATNVDPKISALYFAADRVYNIESIKRELHKGNHVILDRYVYSNMAHQGGKMFDATERHNMYKWLEQLEFNLLGLPEADIKVFLHMPYQYAEQLKKNRSEKPDQFESSKDHLLNAEQAYLEIAKLYNFKTIECVKDNKIKTISEINSEIIKYIKEQIVT